MKRKNKDREGNDKAMFEDKDSVKVQGGTYYIVRAGFHYRN